MSSKIQAINKCSRIIDEIFWELLKILKTGKPQTEISLANKIRSLSKKFGGDGMAFPPIVSFGKNASEIHHSPTRKKLGKNNFLMLDYGVKVSGYCSDFTRTLFIGKPSKFQRKIYNIVLKAQLAAIRKIKIGSNAKTIDRAARSLIANSGYGKYYTHGTGHGVGKKIHEAPSFKPNSEDRVPNNRVVTAEPGIYLPHKFGVRIEDMIRVAKKPKIFSAVPKDLESMIVKI